MNYLIKLLGGYTKDTIREKLRNLPIIVGDVRKYRDEAEREKCIETALDVLERVKKELL